MVRRKTRAICFIKITITAKISGKLSAQLTEGLLLFHSSLLPIT